MSLTEIQNKLKAPKSQYNDFGKYHYRNCEDILEAVKPLLLEFKATLTVSDELTMVGDRYYIKATATLTTGDLPPIHNTSYAREALDKKGMDESQITGAASSYARKYALNGLFLIDDTKDADSMDNTAQEVKSANPEKPWYNDFNKHKDTMIDRIGDGESVEIIIQSLKENFKLSKETEKNIRELG